jgi:hypothetical protein
MKELGGFLQMDILIKIDWLVTFVASAEQL